MTKSFYVIASLMGFILALASPYILTEYKGRHRWPLILAAIAVAIGLAVYAVATTVHRMEMPHHV